MRHVSHALKSRHDTRSSSRIKICSASNQRGERAHRSYKTLFQCKSLVYMIISCLQISQDSYNPKELHISLMLATRWLIRAIKTHPAGNRRGESRTKGVLCIQNSFTMQIFGVCNNFLFVNFSRFPHV